MAESQDDEAEHRYGFDPFHAQRGDQPLVRLRWLGTTLAWQRGRLGDWVTERTERLDSVEARDAAVARVCASWLASGLSLANSETEIVRGCSARDPDLERAIRTDDSLDSARVYADWLQRQGDPRGLVMALDLARDEQPRSEIDRAFEAGLIEHRSHLFGPLGDPRASVRLTWRAGLVDAIDLEELSATRVPWPTGDLELLEQLLALPICGSLRSLRTTSSLARKPSFERTLLNADPELLAGLRELAVIPRHGFDGFADWSLLAGLERLGLGCASLAPIRLPNLRALSLRPWPIEEALAGLCASELPELHTLTIDLHHTLPSAGHHRPRMSYTKAFTELLRVPWISTLHTLTVVCDAELDGHELPAWVMGVLLDSPTLRDLAVVDLTHTRLTPTVLARLHADPRPNFRV